jgi:hypothetical protein
MNFSRHKITSANAPQTSDQSLAKYIGTSVLIAAFAFVFAAILHGLSGSDRDGQGLVILGLTFFAAPVMAFSGAMSFVFRRTVIGEFFGGACLFGAVFFGTLFISG